MKHDYHFIKEDYLIFFIPLSTFSMYIFLFPFFYKKKNIKNISIIVCLIQLMYYINLGVICK